MPNAKKSFMGSVRVSAEIAKKHALIKKRELTDLKSVHGKLGDYAFQNQIGRDQLTEQFTAIESLDTEVQKKRTHDAVADTATITDKAKHAASVAKDRAVVEALLLRRKSLLAELGRALCGYEVDDETITGLQQEAKALQAEINKLKAEALELEQSVSGIAKKPFIAGGIAVVGLIVIMGALVGIKNSCSRSGQIRSATREANQAAANINREVASMQKDMLDLDMQMKKEQLEEIELRKLEQAKRELEEKQRALEIQRQAAEQRATEEARRARVEQEAREKAQSEELAKQTKNQEDTARRAKEQRDRAEYAHKSFSSISLTPDVVIAPSLKAKVSGVEVKGRNIEDIKNRYNRQDWLGLLNLLNNSTHEEYPEVNVIDQAVEKLGKYKYSILLRTNYRLKQYEELYFINFQTDPYWANRASDLVDIDYTDWEKHPDGIGYIHEWTPYHGQVIILTGDGRGQAEEYIPQIVYKGFKGAAEKQWEALEKKHEMGEISQEALQSRIAELKRNLHRQVVEWAMQR